MPGKPGYPQGSPGEDNPFMGHYSMDEDGDLANHRNQYDSPEVDGTQVELSDLPRIVPYYHNRTNSEVPYPESEGEYGSEKDYDEEWAGDERRFTSRPVSQFIHYNPESAADSTEYADSQYNSSSHLPLGEDFTNPLEPPPTGPFTGQDNDPFQPGSNPVSRSITPYDEAPESGWMRRQNLSRIKRANTRKVGLVDGHVFRSEYPVPTAVRDSVLPRYRDEESGSTEFSHMRYTAATCDPDDFTPGNGYSLRALEYERETELLVCVTYYNEDKVLTARTLYGVMQNIRDICRIKRSAFWGGADEAWKKIHVVLVMDGIDPCDKNVLDVLATMGLYQDGVMKRQVNGEETVAHIFEYTTQLCVSSNQKLIRPEEGNPNSLPPIQMTLCIKQKNAKKINSHRWVFNAFCPILRPEVVILIDAGTRPGNKSLLYLWQTFYNDPTCGGACGEIHAMLGRHYLGLLNPLVASQNFEYKISNILDKPLESVFGYISVLPGAFSAYRYRAVEGRPLQQYFHGDHTLSKRLGKKGIDGMSIFRKNMFLAEDRILCLEVIFKRSEKWHLTFVRESKGETDVPEGISELMGQRRRWLNGSFAAGIYGLMHFGRVYHSVHNPLRLLFLHFQFVFNICNQILTWFNLGCYYLFVTIIIEICANPEEFESTKTDKEPESFPFAVKPSSIISQIVKYVYGLFVVISFLLALGNKPKGSKYFYYVMIAVFGVIMMYAIVVSLWLAANAAKSLSDVSSVQQFFGEFFTSTTALVLVALASTFGLYIVTAIIYLDPWHVITSMIQYFFMMPSFVNIVNVYAFCNWHDVSWGTKGSDSLGALPAVQAIREGDKTVVEEVVLDLEDVDKRFHQVVKRALAPYKPAEESSELSMDDQSRMFRTYLIVTWLVSNVVLIWAITSTESQAEGMSTSVQSRIRGFFAFLLWSNAVVAAVRFIGSVAYVVQQALKRVFHRR